MPESITIRDQRNGDWYWIHKTVYEQYAAKIGIIGLGLYNAFCYYANHNSQVAFPSLVKLEKDLGISRPTILKHVKVLEDNGLVRVTRRRGRNNVNEVYLLRINTEKKVKLLSIKGKGALPEQELITIKEINKEKKNFSLGETYRNLIASKKII